jgi:maltooligosyltrehalose trehalohydrolase
VEPCVPRLGAVCLSQGRTRFRVWAPLHRRVELLLEQPESPRALAMAAEPDGCFALECEAGPGTRYRYRLAQAGDFPDPCSRFQPEGPHGPSEVVDPALFHWTSEDFVGVDPKDAVLYELHVGTFTPEGTWRAAEERLGHLRRLGVTVLELMPVAGFPGRFNWGYDGVNLFAPAAIYGRPDDLRRFVDAAHRHGLAVILDVVYNHLGPDGNYLAQYASTYFTDRYPGEWGDPVNFDGEGAAQVRAFFVENVRHWICEYRLDGLRFDATQSLHDASERHILSELTAAARAAAPHRRLYLMAENEPQDRRTVLEPPQGHGCDALWVDDFHHTSRVAATLRSEAYTRDYRGTAPELLACVRYGSLYAGQWYSWQNKRRGSPLHDLPPWRLVFYLQNHDQVANLSLGDRLHVFGEPRVRALTVFWLLLPQTPLLFMGQEYFASTPFHYFVDHPAQLHEQVRQGRADFVSQFPSTRSAMLREGADSDIGEQAHRRSRLDWSELDRRQPALALHRELLRLRREDKVFRRRQVPEGAALNAHALVLRWFGSAEHGDRLLLLNLGPDLVYEPCPNPLLAPPAEERWAQVLSSREVRFGGHGAVHPDGTSTWAIPGQCGLLLASQPLAAPLSKKESPDD